MMELNKIRQILDNDLSGESIIFVLPELLKDIETEPFIIYTLRSVLLDILSLYEEQEKLDSLSTIGKEKICNLSDFAIKQKVNKYLKKGILKSIDLMLANAPADIKYRESSMLIKNLINLEFKSFR